MKRSFKPGDPVFHRRLGFGTIVEAWGGWLDIDPEHGKELTINGGNIFEVEFSGSGRRSVSGASLQLDHRRELAGKNR
jgi:hypothetical protein